jgi:hypothetical protein
MPRKSPTTAPGIRHDCVTFDDGSGHKWHVPFDEIVSIPRVGEEVLLPSPSGSDKLRYSVVSVAHEFDARRPPKDAIGISARGNDKWIYAGLGDVIVRIDQTED